MRVSPWIFESWQVCTYSKANREHTIECYSFFSVRKNCHKEHTKIVSIYIKCQLVEQLFYSAHQCDIFILTGNQLGYEDI